VVKSHAKSMVLKESKERNGIWANGRFYRLAAAPFLCLLMLQFKVALLSFPISDENISYEFTSKFLWTTQVSQVSCAFHLVSQLKLLVEGVAHWGNILFVLSDFLFPATASPSLQTLGIQGPQILSHCLQRTRQKSLEWSSLSFFAFLLNCVHNHDKPLCKTD